MNVDQGSRLKQINKRGNERGSMASPNQGGNPGGPSRNNSAPVIGQRIIQDSVERQYATGEVKSHPPASKVRKDMQHKIYCNIKQTESSSMLHVWLLFILCSFAPHYHSAIGARH